MSGLLGTPNKNSIQKDSTTSLKATPQFSKLEAKDANKVKEVPASEWIEPPIEVDDAETMEEITEQID